MIVRHLPVRQIRLDLEAAAAASGVHPELLARLADLDLVDSVTDSQGRRWFARTAPARVHMIMRLRADLALNYASIALVLDLLSRIDELEGRRQLIQRDKDKPPWT
ncbi:MAG: MerR family transcriptional regulator, heat shock protein HspR [Microbacteriaceae bacterium]|jgi:hypothetical protein|nr:MerR family transcriptional regulator, heat shock protein HspR [Microbacteriaceae bacterium]